VPFKLSVYASLFEKLSTMSQNIIKLSRCIEKCSENEFIKLTGYYKAKSISRNFACHSTTALFDRKWSQPNTKILNAGGSSQVAEKRNTLKDAMSE